MGLLLFTTHVRIEERIDVGVHVLQQEGRQVVQVFIEKERERISPQVDGLTEARGKGRSWVSTSAWGGGKAQYLIVQKLGVVSSCVDDVHHVFRGLPLRD
jgi:hypothetical protein